MQLTIHLPDHLGRQVRDQRDPDGFVAAAIAKALRLPMETQRPTAAKMPSRWTKLVERIEASPAQLDGYGEAMKRDMREFRDDCEFKRVRDA